MATPDDLDRLLQPDYLGDVQSRSIEEIRAMREECRHAEDGLSYVRRQAQGQERLIRLDAIHQHTDCGRQVRIQHAAQHRIADQIRILSAVANYSGGVSTSGFAAAISST